MINLRINNDGTILARHDCGIESIKNILVVERENSYFFHAPGFKIASIIPINNNHKRDSILMPVCILLDNYARVVFRTINGMPRKTEFSALIIIDINSNIDCADESSDCPSFDDLFPSMVLNTLEKEQSDIPHSLTHNSKHQSLPTSIMESQVKNSLHDKQSHKKCEKTLVKSKSSFRLT